MGKIWDMIFHYFTLIKKKIASVKPGLCEKNKVEIKIVFNVLLCSHKMLVYCLIFNYKYLKLSIVCNNTSF